MLGKLGKFVKEHPYETATVGIILIAGLFLLVKPSSSSDSSTTSAAGPSDALLAAEMQTQTQQAQIAAATQQATIQANAAITAAQLQAAVQQGQTQAAVDIAASNNHAQETIAKTQSDTSIGVATQSQILGTNQAMYNELAIVGVAKAQADEAVAISNNNSNNNLLNGIIGLAGSFL